MSKFKDLLSTLNFYKYDATCAIVAVALMGSAFNMQYLTHGKSLSNQHQLEANKAGVAYADTVDGARYFMKATNANHHPIMLVISASWCHVCEAYKHDVLYNSSVMGPLKSKYGVTVGYLDVSNQDSRSDEIMSKYHLQGVPATVFIDSSGKQVAIKSGELSGGEIASTLSGMK